MVAVPPLEDLKEMCQRLEEQEVEAQVGVLYLPTHTPGEPCSSSVIPDPAFQEVSHPYPDPVPLFKTYFGNSIIWQKISVLSYRF
jgi:hypothetical protein